MGRVSITTTSNFPEVAARLERGAAAAPLLSNQQVVTACHEIADAMVPILESHTPVGVTEPHLFETSRADVTDMGKGAMIEFRQTKTVPKGYVLAPLLIEGHRIVTRSGIDTGRSTSPDDYLTPAMDEGAPIIDDLLGQSGVNTCYEIVKVMGG